ncbi:MAG TPA: peptidoglycan-binding domain-containing protein [Candidatus Paceibacterota bacterium]|nr:peptidoglycan-binding domain-containing protein [Candidatus Paceibacterota bacterium]
MKHIIGAAISAAFLALSSFFAFSLALSSVSAAGCLSVSSNLFQGMTDSTAGGQIRALQDYLFSAGYLSATPNGVFGPATAGAVKKFQLANGISSTGNVGDLTRVALRLKSCASSVVPVPSTTTPTPTPAQTPVSSAQTVQSYTALSSPQAGENLMLGDTYAVRWTSLGNGQTMNIVLENATGTALGFIVAGSYGNQYSWHVGDVNNANSLSLQTVPPGTYRIHVENASVGPQAGDQASGVFTIAANVSVSQMFPRVAAADGNTTVILYGSGYKSTSMVDLYGYGTVPPLFVSPDGRAIAFAVPTGATPGVHSVTVLNSYSGSDATSESNSMQLTVIRP